MKQEKHSQVFLTNQQVLKVEKISIVNTLNTRVQMNHSCLIDDKNEEIEFQKVGGLHGKNHVDKASKRQEVIVNLGENIRPFEIIDHYDFDTFYLF